MTHRRSRTCAACSTGARPILASASSTATSRVASPRRRTPHSRSRRATFVGFIDNDDVLRPHALYRDGRVPPRASGRGRRVLRRGQAPCRWQRLVRRHSSRTSLRTACSRRTTSITSPWCAAIVVADVGGFREGFDGSQDHDLVLRVTENAAHVGHVPDVLYAWRMVPGSTAVSAGFKPLAQDAGRRAVADALRRRGVDGRVNLGPSPGLYIPRYAITGAPSVDVVVVARTAAPTRLIASPSSSVSPRLSDRRITSVIAGDNTPIAINAAVRRLTGDHVVLLDASTRVISPTWMEAMLELSQRAGDRRGGHPFALSGWNRCARGHGVRTSRTCKQCRSAPARHQRDECRLRRVSDDATRSVRSANSIDESLPTRSGTSTTACGTSPRATECSVHHSPR